MSIMSNWMFMDLVRRNCFGRSEVPNYPRYEHVNPPLRLEQLERVNSNISELSTPSPSSSVVTMSPCTPTPSPSDITGEGASNKTDQLGDIIDNVGKYWLD